MQIGIARGALPRCSGIAEAFEGFIRQVFTGLKPFRRYICVQVNGGEYKCQPYTAKLRRRILRLQQKGVAVKFYFCCQTF